MMKLWYRLPLALKAALIAGALSLATGLTLVAALQVQQRDALHERVDALGNALAARLAAGAARPLVQNDPVSLQAVLAGFAQDAPVQRVVVFDLNQQLLGAAGNETPEAQDYSATIHWQDSAVGRAVLSLRPQLVHDERGLLGALALAGLAAVACSLAALWFGRRVERLLALLTRRLSGEQLQIDYPGCDALGRLLHAPAPPLLMPEPPPKPRCGVVLLQLQCPTGAAPADCARALQLVSAVSKVYGGSAAITRAGGVTARFDVEDEVESPFNALCAAQLLAHLGADGNYRLALTALAAADDGDVWLEQDAIERCRQACVSETAAAVLIDAPLRRHPALGERTALAPVGEPETETSWWRVEALVSPYDTLLERQLQMLRSQLPV